MSKISAPIMIDSWLGNPGGVGWGGGRYGLGAGKVVSSSLLKSPAVKFFAKFSLDKWAWTVNDPVCHLDKLIESNGDIFGSD